MKNWNKKDILIRVSMIIQAILFVSVDKFIQAIVISTIFFSIECLRFALHKCADSIFEINKVLMENFEIIENYKKRIEILENATTSFSHNHGLDSTGSQKQEKCILETNDRRKHE